MADSVDYSDCNQQPCKQDGASPAESHRPQPAPQRKCYEDDVEDYEAALEVG
jgi:hypothetical protein